VLRGRFAKQIPTSHWTNKLEEGSVTSLKTNFREGRGPRGEYVHNRQALGPDGVSFLGQNSFGTVVEYGVHRKWTEVWTSKARALPVIITH